MVDVGGNDGATDGDFVAHEFRGDEFGNTRTLGIAGVLVIDGIAAAHLCVRQCASVAIATRHLGLERLHATQVFSNRYIFHFRCDDPASRVVHLRDVGVLLCATTFA